MVAVTSKTANGQTQKKRAPPISNARHSRKKHNRAIVALKVKKNIAAPRKVAPAVVADVVVAVLPTAAIASRMPLTQKRKTVRIKLLMLIRLAAMRRQLNNSLNRLRPAIDKAKPTISKVLTRKTVRQKIPTLIKNSPIVISLQAPLSRKMHLRRPHRSM